MSCSFVVVIYLTSVVYCELYLFLTAAFYFNSPAHANMAEGMYTPEGSMGSRRGQHAASIMLHDEEHAVGDSVNVEDEGPAKYLTPPNELLENTQRIDPDKVGSVYKIRIYTLNMAGLPK